MTEPNDTLITLLETADPALGDEPQDVDRREAIRRRATEELTGPGRARVKTPHPHRYGRLAVGVAGVTAVAAAGAIVVLIAGAGSVGPTASPSFAAAAIRIAEANPRFLINASGWRVTGANEFQVDEGETDFTDGERSLRIMWSPARNYIEPDIHELREGARGPEGSLGNPITPGPGEIQEHFEWVTVLGRRAFLSYDPGGRFYRLMLPPENGSSTMIEGHSHDDSMTRGQFLALVDSLYRADVETWLAALPPRIVRPVDNAATVDRMLEGIPIPDSVDTAELRSLDLALSRYQLGAKVTGAVSCGWLDQWAAAVKSGGGDAAREAVEAMATSHDWAILREMEDEGGWSQVVWEYSREMANDNRAQLLGIGGGTQTPNGRVFDEGPAYAPGLGCDSLQRTPRRGTPMPFLRHPGP